MFTGKCVTFYNDNKAAAAAIETKAPALWRNDLQYLTREISFLSVKYKFYFWGIHINGDKNDHADALSRFKPYDWKGLGYTMVDAKTHVEKHFEGLRRFYPNREEKYWQWTEQQKEILKIKTEKAEAERLVYGRNKLPRKKRKELPVYNILTRSRFDND